jgi:hypothetical protein
MLNKRSTPQNNAKLPHFPNCSTNSRCCVASLATASLLVSRRGGFTSTINSVRNMFGKIYSTDSNNWAVIVAGNGRTFTALPSAASESVFSALRRGRVVQFDVVQVNGRELVRNLQRADSITASVNRAIA